MRLTVLLALAALAWMTGCATTPSALDQDGGGFGFWEQRDDFQLLQHSAGLEEDSWHQAGEELEIDDARALWETLARRETTLHDFGPRRCLIFVLRQVLTRGEDVAYAELLQRVRPLRALAVMRPDGYLVGALTGKPLQRMGMGRVALRDGRLMVGSFEVGAFYRDRGGVFYTVDDSLRQPGIMVGELHHCDSAGGKLWRRLRPHASPEGARRPCRWLQAVYRGQFPGEPCKVDGRASCGITCPSCVPSKVRKGIQRDGYQRP